MIKNKEDLVQEQTEKICEKIKDYVKEMDKLSDSKEFTIDNIEKMWGELEEYTKQVYKEINAEVIKQINEKKIIQEKKGICKERSDTKK